MDQIKLGLVGVVAAVMITIAVEAVLRARRRRAADRAADARARHVTVQAALAGAATDEDARFQLADLIDDELGDAGEVLNARPRPPGLAGETGLVDIEIRLHDGDAGMAALRRALLAAGVPSESALSWTEAGVVARDRLRAVRT